jgi:hypothetical protein
MYTDWAPLVETRITRNDFVEELPRFLRLFLIAGVLDCPPYSVLPVVISYIVISILDCLPYSFLPVVISYIVISSACGN